MRISSLLRARKDMVELLIRQGRLADVQMLNFFSGQLARERSAEEATGQEDSALTAARDAKQSALNAFNKRCTAVQQLSSTAGPTAWLKEAYGSTTWSTSFLSCQTVQAAGAASADGKLTLSGKTSAVGAAGVTPTAVDIVVNVEGTRDPVVVTVPVQQAGKVSTKMVNGMLQVQLTGAQGTVKPNVSAKDMAAAQHVLTAAAYTGLLEKLEEVCALHATSAVQFDGLLIRNPAVQMRLSQIACFRFGVEALRSYVVGDAEVETAEDAMLNLPLMESVVLNMYAENALMDGMDCAWEVVRDTPLCKQRPHRSKATKMIDYPFLQDLFHTPKYSLTSVDGSMELQAMEFLAPLLEGSQLDKAVGAFRENPLNKMLGMSAGRARLAAPHANLRLMAATVEEDVATFLSTISNEKSRNDPTFAYAMGQYLSELMANIAVVYRCTAALNADEEGKGHREWLLTQAFSAASAARRQKMMADYNMSRSATRILKKAADLDGYSTHPVELMNASPRRASEKTSNSNSSSSSSAASASEQKS